MLTFHISFITLFVQHCVVSASFLQVSWPLSRLDFNCLYIYPLIYLQIFLCIYLAIPLSSLHNLFSRDVNVHVSHPNVTTEITHRLKPLIKPSGRASSCVALFSGSTSVQSHTPFTSGSNEGYVCIMQSS